MMNLLFGGIAAAFLAMSIAAVLHLRYVRRLPALAALPTATGEPPARCSVVMAVRDEADRIESTIRRLSGQTGVSLEIIVVDDRSADETRAILARLAAADARVRITRVDTLPSGWLGKCHACHLGARIATSEWILFTDGDCWLKPDAIARALHVAHRDGADHVTMTPGTEMEGGLARAWYILFLISVLGWIAGTNRDRPRSYVGFGAFNLVRASAYRACGGYEALRLTILDDVRLGLILRRAGKRTRAFLGGDDVRCHWGTRLRDMVKIMEKNYFAALDYRLELVVAGTAFAILVFCIVVLGLIRHTPLGIAATLSPLSLIAPAAILAQRIGWPRRAALAVPFMMPVLLYAALNSTFVTLKQGGVRWRDTFYPLSELRAFGVK